MAIEEWQTYCPRCQCLVLGRREKPNHLLHFIITLFTCLWAIVWIILTLNASSQPFYCPNCGTAGQNS